MSNCGCIENDGSVLPAQLSMIEDNRLGVVITVTDYHGDTTAVIIDKETLEKLVNNIAK